MNESGSTATSAFACFGAIGSAVVYNKMSTESYGYNKIATQRCGYKLILFPPSLGGMAYVIHVCIRSQ
jgi:hypothetical protein